MATTSQQPREGESTSAADALLQRTRAALAGHPLREVRMFGVLAVMVEGAMVVAVHPDGSLLVRVDPGCAADLLTRPGAQRATMGNGRPMGPGWIHVRASAVDGDDALRSWIQHATGRLRPPPR